MIKRCFYIILLFGFTTGFASNPPSEGFYQHYITGNMKAWENTLNNLEIDYKNDPNLETLHEIVKAQYGLVAYYIGNNKKDKASAEITEAQKHLAKLSKAYPSKYLYKAWQGAFLGYRLGVSPWKVVYLGPQSQDYIELALENAPHSPEVNFEYANMKFWSPAIVGGDKKLSLVYYKKTIHLLERQGKTNDWYYLWALTAYANALKTMDNFEEATGVYNKILSIEPNYEWVANELAKTKQALPDLDL